MMNSLVNLPGTSAVEGLDSAEGARARQVEAEKWAALLSATLTPHDAPVLSGGVTEGWRTVANPMTTASQQTGTTSSENAAPAGAVSGDAREPDDSGARLTFTVDAGELGELSLVVDRQSDGVRIVIGVSDAQASRTLVPERALLEEALRNSGINLSSVSFVRIASDGPNLAQREVVKRMVPTQGGDGGKSSADPARKRVNLVG